MLPFVPTIVPNIVQALVLVCAFCLALATVMRSYDVCFYIVFAGAAVASFIPAVENIPAAAMLLELFASCYTGVAFYLLVMFAGALPKRWWFTKRLLSVRSEMSIIGGIIIAAHCLRVIATVPLAFSSYWPTIWGNASVPMMIASGIVGPVLLVCFLVPWITSFPFVRNNMEFKTWKKTQKLAYPFMACLILQGTLLAVGHALYLGTASMDYTCYIATAVVYVTLGVAYVVLKLAKVGKPLRQEMLDSL